MKNLYLKFLARGFKVKMSVKVSVEKIAGLLAANDAIHEFINEADGSLARDLQDLAREHDIVPGEALKKFIVEQEQSGRLLSIGFVGRVKAGKSSLLNAMFFDGRSVLPKAATPMTAALTTLEYGESFSAEVEFFSHDELEMIAMGAKDYRRALGEEQEKLRNELLKKGQEPDMGKIEKSSKRKIDGRSPRLAALNEQQEMISASGIEALEGIHQIDAKGADDLMQSLQCYVGAKGEYTAFTKMVKVKMPMESLRDIRVVDTPGINDPVISREQRTHDLLKSCDVIFLVSPSQQFLDAADDDLIARITESEGIQELVLVASQADAAIRGPEFQGKSFVEVLSKVKSDISSRAVKVLEGKRDSILGSDKVIEKLIEKAKSGVILNSGMCSSIRSCLQNSGFSGLDNEEYFAWRGLKECYPDFFQERNVDRCMANLEKIAALAEVDAAIEGVRCRKEAIMADKLESFIEAKIECASKFRKDAIELIHGKIDELESADIAELNMQISSLERDKIKVEHDLNVAYEDCRDEYLLNLKKKLIDEVGEISQKVNKELADSRSERERQVKVKKDGVLAGIGRFLGVGGYETKLEREVKVNATAVVAALNNFMGKISVEFSEQALEARKKFDRKLSAELASVDVPVDVDALQKAIKSVVRIFRDKCSNLKFTLEVNSSMASRCGILSGSEANKFLGEVNTFLAQVPQVAQKSVDGFVSAVKQALPSRISDDLIMGVERGLRELVANKSQQESLLEKYKELKGKIFKIRVGG